MKIGSTSIWFIFAPLTCAAIPLVCIPAADWMAVARHGGVGFLWFPRIFTFIALAAFAILLHCVIGLAIRRVRYHSASLALCSVAYLVAFFISLRIGGSVRVNEFHRLAERSKPLISAIRAFEQKQGHPPDSLEVLVPEFISSVPFTGMKAYPEYRYLAGNANWNGNPWVLIVFTPSGEFNFDQFMYFPLTNYPDSGYGGRLERVGDWAYVHTRYPAMPGGETK
jgi:hypothetical protein